MDTEQPPVPRTVDVRTAEERALDQVAELRERIARERETARALAEYLEAAGRLPAVGWPRSAP